MKYHCPKCGSKNTQRRGYAITSKGIRKIEIQCNECKKYSRHEIENFDTKESRPEDIKETNNSALEFLKTTAKEFIKKEIGKNRPISVGELSRETSLSKELIIKILDDIKDDTGLPIQLDNGRIHIEKEMAVKSFKPLNIEKLFKNNLKIGFVSDTHLGSKYQQVTLLHSAYETFEKEGVNFVAHAGDLCDGSPSMHTGFLHEIFLHTFEEQVEYVSENYPKSNLFKTYIRPGNHDNSWIKANAGDPVRQVCKKRDDLIYISPAESSFSHKNSNILVELFHPAGGMPYSKSYRPQKILATIYNILSEYKSDVKNHLPQVLAIGHLHQINYFLDSNCHVFLLPAFQSVTPFLKSKALNPSVGFLIVDFEFDDLGNILKITPKIFDLNSQIIKNDY